MREQQESRRVTIRDVARDANVSKSTVSLVIKGSPLVSPETAEVVRAAAKRLGYVYNRTAANLRTQRTQTVGLIASDIANPFFAELFTAIADKLEGEGIVVMLANTAEDPERQRRAITTFLEHNVDGLFISPAKHARPEHLGPLLTSGLPTVFVNRYIPGVAANYVGADNVVGAGMATERLIAGGHSRIAFVGGGPGATSTSERTEGFTRALRKHGLVADPALFINSDGTRRGGYLSAKRLISLPDPPTAAFCHNDVIALGVLLGLQAEGIRPGRDFAVFGFDDVSEASLSTPALSTVCMPPDVVGRRAVDFFIHKGSDWDTVETVLIAPKLAVRESCGTQSCEGGDMSHGVHQGEVE